MFVVGIDEEGQTGQAVCPNCGQRGLDDAPAIECGGDRVLVQKFLYDFRRPKRWEVAVFHFPGEPTPGVRQARGRPAGRVDPDRRRRRLRRRPDRPEVAGRDPGDADPGPRQPIPAARCRPIPALAVSARIARIRRSRAAGSAQDGRFVHDAARRRPGRDRRLARSTGTGTRPRTVRAGPRFLRLQRRRAPRPRTRSPTWRSKRA